MRIYAYYRTVSFGSIRDANVASAVHFVGEDGKNGVIEEMTADGVIDQYAWFEVVPMATTTKADTHNEHQLVMTDILHDKRIDWTCSCGTVGIATTGYSLGGDEQRQTLERLARTRHRAHARRRELTAQIRRVRGTH
jgi:hypothetical protein